MSLSDDIRRWRSQAREARTIAEEMTDVECKRKMLQVAQDYEKMADRAEKDAALALRSHVALSS